MTAEHPLPYITDEQELAGVITDLSNALLWRRCGYDERPPTAEDVSEVLQAIDDAREAFLVRSSQQVVPAGRHLHAVRSAG